MRETNSFTITLGGRPRRVWLSLRACQNLGMKGPGDTEGIKAALQNALNDFGNLARLVLALIVREDKADLTEASVKEELLDTWDAESVERFIEQLNRRGDSSDAGELLATAPPNGPAGP